MAWTREALIQSYLEGTLTPEAQKEFDRLFRNDPSFSDALTKTMEKILASGPDEARPPEGKNPKPPAAFPWKKLGPSKAWVGPVLLVLSVLVGLSLLIQDISGRGKTEPSTAIDPTSPAAVKALASAPAMTPTPMKMSPAAIRAAESSAPPVQTLLTPVAREDSIELPPGEKLSGTGEDLKFQEGNKIYLSTESAKTQPVEVYVLGVGGTLVRRIYEGPWEKGPHQIVWDGMDDLGRQAPPGQYAVVLKTGGKTLSDQVTIQPQP